MTRCVLTCCITNVLSFHGNTKVFAVTQKARNGLTITQLGNRIGKILTHLKMEEDSKT